MTVFPGVATMFRRLLDLPGFSGRPLGLRLGVSGAAPCPWDLAQEWRAAHRGAHRPRLRDDRAVPPALVSRPTTRPIRRVRRAARCPASSIRVVDDDGPRAAGRRDRRAVDPHAGGDGRLPRRARGHRARSSTTAGSGPATSPRVTADGYVAIVGRKRERIKRGGYSVFPAEVEAVVLAHPAVAEAAVVGVPDAELGEEIAAFVTLRPGAAADADELIAWCRERLAAYKYPRRVVIVAELPEERDRQDPTRAPALSAARPPSPPR